VQNILSSSWLYKNIKIIRTVILPVVLYGCETSSLILREEHRPTLIENGMLRMMFGPQRYEITGEWRRLRNEKLYDLYCSPNIIRVTILRRVGWVRHIARRRHLKKQF